MSTPIDLPPHMLAVIDQTNAAKRPHIEALLETAQAMVDAHGPAADAVLSFMLDESKHYPYDVMCALVAHFAIEETKRQAVSDVD